MIASPKKASMLTARSRGVVNWRETTAVRNAERWAPRVGSRASHGVALEGPIGYLKYSAPPGADLLSCPATSAESSEPTCF